VLPAVVVQGLRHVLDHLLPQYACAAQVSLALRRLAKSQMAGAGRAMLDLARRRNPEAFLGTLVCFLFGHGP